MQDHLVAGLLDAETLSGLISECRSADDALARLARAVDGAFSIHRASIRRVDLQKSMAVVVAVWSGLPTSLTPGLEVSLRATSYPEVQREGRSVLFESEYEPLLDHLLKEEGIRSWVTTPLFEGREIRGLLSFSSWRTGAFAEEDRAFFDHVGLAVQQTLIPLLTL